MRWRKSRWMSICKIMDAIRVLVGSFLDASRILTMGSSWLCSVAPSRSSMIQRKFKMDMGIFPVPSNDFRVEIADHELSRIQQDVEARVQDAAQNAMKEAWQRLYDRVQHMAEKLADPKAVFRDTLVENTREVCAVLSRLNFTDDPNLEAMRQQVEQSLANHHPDALRNDPDLRRDKAAEANDIMKRMGAFMGA